MRNTLIVLVLVLLGSVASSASAQGTLHPFFAGQTSPPWKSHCMQLDSGLGTPARGMALAVRPIFECDGYKTYGVSLPIGMPGAWTIRIRATVTTGGEIACTPYAISPTGVETAGTTSRLTSGSGWQTLEFRTPSVPAGGTLFVTCEMSPNLTSRWLSIAWF